MISVEQIMAYLESKKIQFVYKGSLAISVSGFSTVERLGENSILWVKDSKRFNLQELKKIKSMLVVTTPEQVETLSLYCSNILSGENSKEIFFETLSHFFADNSMKYTIANTATVLTNKIGDNVSIGHHSFIGKDVIVGNHVQIEHNVSIQSAVKIGDYSIIHSGVVIGTEGYGYYLNSEGVPIQVPHFGGVTIGKNVEIGANTCIDRGTLEDTKIGNDVKIDNLCHIAHNVVIEDNVNVIALSMIAGSVTLKKGAYIAPSASIRNQLTIGENSTVGLGAVVVKDVEANTVVAGVPAKVMVTK